MRSSSANKQRENMEITKEELSIVLIDTAPDTSIRFSLNNEELEVASINPYDASGDVWVTLIVKGEYTPPDREQ